MTVTVTREHVLFFGCRRSRRRWRQSKPSDSYHSQPHRQRMESHSLSFLRIALQTAHDLTHITLLPAPALSRVAPGDVPFRETGCTPLAQRQLLRCRSSCHRSVHSVGVPNDPFGDKTSVI